MLLISCDINDKSYDSRILGTWVFAGTGFSDEIIESVVNENPGNIKILEFTEETYTEYSISDGIIIYTNEEHIFFEGNTFDNENSISNGGIDYFYSYSIDDNYLKIKPPRICEWSFYSRYVGSIPPVAE